LGGGTQVVHRVLLPQKQSQGSLANTEEDADVKKDIMAHRGW